MFDLTLHFLIFIIVGSVAFVLVPLTLGWFVRPNSPTEEKVATYECGEPTIGSSYVQFDIRFYVVALLFIIFDVEVAFFYPWATVFGGATQLADPRLSDAARMNLSDRLLDVAPGTSTPDTMLSAANALQMAWMGFGDILVFFGVLMVGFAYVWSRGDLDWVRALMQQVREDKAKARSAA
jgi:NADH-quinone oxidoreductase subunit A